MCFSTYTPKIYNVSPGCPALPRASGFSLSHQRSRVHQPFPPGIVRLLALVRIGTPLEPAVESTTCDRFSALLPLISLLSQMCLSTLIYITIQIKSDRSARVRSVHSMEIAASSGERAYLRACMSCILHLRTRLFPVQPPPSPAPRPRPATGIRKLFSKITPHVDDASCLKRYKGTLYR